ncbi:MAG: FAD-dependent oxidoreductase [Clostridia bacterium]|nr:FAD-dependent oxidoreductase [Clostridia bacterium]
MSEFIYTNNIPDTIESEVVVVGGGPAGLCAAVAAARGGAKVLLVEKNAFCGGMATAGMVAPFMTCYDSGGDKMLIRGIFEELVERLIAVGGAIHPSKVESKTAFTSYIDKGHVHVTPFKAESLKIVADEMLAEAGVRILYHTQLVDAEAEGDKVTRIIVAMKEGLASIRAKAFIDCTGDGDLAAKAGAAYTIGNAQGKMQPATMFFTVGGVDTKRVDEDIAKNWDNFYRKDGINYRSLHWRVSEAREAGDWPLDRVSIGLFRGVEEDEFSINTSRVMNIDGTKSESLTEGEIAGRQQVRIIFNFLKKYVPGFENSRLILSGSTLGIRETRHIEGIRTLTVDQILSCEVPEDSIMLAANSVDVHGKYGPKSNEYITIPAGKCYGVPYGTMIPPAFSNLAVAGRPISADCEAAGAIRVMPPCMGIGQAAGTAVAMAVLGGYDLRTLDVKALREKLSADGVMLEA